MVDFPGHIFVYVPNQGLGSPKSDVQFVCSWLRREVIARFVDIG